MFISFASFFDYTSPKSPTLVGLINLSLTRSLTSSVRVVFISFIMFLHHMYISHIFFYYFLIFLFFLLRLFVPHFMRPVSPPRLLRFPPCNVQTKSIKVKNNWISTIIYKNEINFVLNYNINSIKLNLMRISNAFSMQGYPSRTVAHTFFVERVSHTLFF